MRTFHATWFYVAVIGNGVVGLWGLVLAAIRRPPGRAFTIGRTAAIVAMLIQVGAGFVLYARGFEPASIHMFYGFLVLFTYTFAYVYRAQMDQRPALAYGLMLLFVMGLGLRAWTNAT
jgi:hypothetical protein